MNSVLATFLSIILGIVFVLIALALSITWIGWIGLVFIIIGVGAILYWVSQFKVY